MCTCIHVTVHVFMYLVCTDFLMFCCTTHLSSLPHVFITTFTSVVTSMQVSAIAVNETAHSGAALSWTSLKTKKESVLLDKESR